ncbi:MAG TPA: TA system VapC family ribonuclease toxin [Propionibacteriaceae bacterium]
MIVDANLLLYAIDATAVPHERVKRWWEQQLNGFNRVGLPWPSLLAFVRISTHPRAARHPLTGTEAWQIVTSWLQCDVVWTPEPGPRHADILRGLIERHQISGNLVPDAHLAALALDYGMPLASADTDFARFPEVRWINPTVEPA